MKQHSTNRLSLPSPSVRAPLKRLRVKQQRKAAQGSALVWALIFVTVLLGTAVAMSRRGFFGLVGSTFVRDSKLAREAAEIGILRTVALLNEPRNRRLLVNATKLTNNSSTSIEADPTLVSPCMGSGPDLSMALGSLKNGSSYPVITIDGQRTYQIQSISQPSSSDESSGNAFNLRMGTSSALENATPGEITIKVKGTAKRGNLIIGEFTLTRTLEVLPKCCGLSLGGESSAFGGDTRQCGANDSGLGLIAGVYYKNDGDFAITGGAGIQFYADAAKTIPQSAVYCIDTSATNDCVNDSGTLSSGTGTTLKEVGTQIPDVPSSKIDPGGCNNNSSTALDSNANNTALSSSTDCVVHIDDDYTLSTKDFENWGKAGLKTTLYGSSFSTFNTTTTSIVYQTQLISSTLIVCTGDKTPIQGQCKSANQTVTVNANAATTTTVTTGFTVTTITTQTSSLVSYSTGTSVATATNAKLIELKNLCNKESEGGTTVIYCSLDQLFIDNNRILTFDTTEVPIRIYFRDASTATSPSILLQNGSSGLGQIQIGISSPPYADMALYGMSKSEALSSAKNCPTTGPCQYLRLGGGNSGTTNFFAYFPAGEATLQGSATIDGMLWANTVKATGSVDFVSTSSGVGSVLSLLDIKNQNNPGSKEPILKEYVTRLSKRFRFF